MVDEAETVSSEVFEKEDALIEVVESSMDEIVGLDFLLMGRRLRYLKKGE